MSLKVPYIIASFAIILLLGSLQEAKGFKDLQDDDDGGGVECAACVIVSSLLEQVAVYNDQPIGTK